MCNPQCPVSKLLDAPKRERHARPPGIGLRLGRVADRGLDPIEADLARIHPLLGMFRETDWTIFRAAGHGRDPSYCAIAAAMPQISYADTTTDAPFGTRSVPRAGFIWEAGDGRAAWRAVAMG
jgi:hypothetical protein